MGTGYTRADTGNNIADGNIINAADLDGEFDAVQAAFDASTGHTHDGTTAEGAPIAVTGPTQEYVSTATELRPKTNNTYDLGSASNQWKDLYVDGTANLDAVDIDGGNIDGTVVGAATPAAGTFTTTTATTGNITTVNATTVDTTNIEVTNLKAKDGTASATIADSTGVMTVVSLVATTADINGGTIDGVTIGGAVAGAITGTTGTFSGDLNLADKIVHIGDTNTAIRFPAADTVTIETAGSERMRIASNGNVGIGTSTPNAKLTIGGDASTAKLVIKNTAAGAETFDGSGAGLELLAGNMNPTVKYTPSIKFGSVDTDFTTTNPKFGAAITSEAVQTYGSDTNGGMNLSLWTAPFNPGVGSGLAERIRILSTGNVGINETIPDYKLDVNGTFGFTPGASVTPVDNGAVVFELTNNTTLTVKAKGSDGVVRSGTITLA
jgi:hypothetical protein